VEAATRDRDSVWVLIVERGVAEGAELNLYRRELAAATAARRYLEQAWPTADILPVGVQDAIEQYNGLPGVAEHVLLASFPIEGHEFFDGDEDPRPRCDVCGQPVVLADEVDPHSWVHADDGNDQADHAAEVDLGAPPPIENGIA